MLSGYRLMWMIVMFDLPTLLPAEQKAATKFREFLLDLGFERAQLSVYMRCCGGKEQCNAYTRRIRPAVPEGGNVQIIYITDKQFARIVCLQGTQSYEPEHPKQFALF